MQLMQTFSEFTRKRFLKIPHDERRKLLLIFLSILVGFIGGLGALIFRSMIFFVNDVLYGIPFMLFNGNPIATVISPAIGGLIVGVLIVKLSKEAKGHGVPEIVESVNLHSGKMRFRVPIVKIIASAITIGTNGSAGSEGPIVQIGGGFASILAQKMHLSKEESKTLVISGVSAGIAGIFNAPLGGVLFGYEIIRKDLKTFNLFPLIMASVVGTAVGEFFFGSQPLFAFPSYANYNLYHNIWAYIILGALVGVYAVIWTKGFYFIEAQIEKIRAHPILIPAIGGLIVGLILLTAPEVSGMDYEPIEAAFHLDYLIPHLIFLVVAKFVATAVSIGSGGSGGIFAPTLFQGVMLGTIFGLTLRNLHIINGGVVIYAILGMAALFAGSTKAPLTAIVMTSEMIGDFHLILPLMFAVIASWVVSGLISEDDIYLLKLKKRGIVFSPSIDILEQTTVAEIMIKDPISVSTQDRIEYVLELMHETHHTGYPVIDGDGHLFGIITEHDVDTALMKKSVKEWSVADVCTTHLVTVHPECSLAEAFVVMGQKHVNRLPVVVEGTEELAGWITRSDVVKTYLHKKSIDVVNAFEMEHLALN